MRRAATACLLALALASAATEASAAPYTFATFDVPGSGSFYAVSPGYTFAQGINDAGQVTGSYNSPTLGSLGFVNTNGTFTSFTVPGAYDITPTGINNVGQVTGDYNTLPSTTWAPSGWVMVGTGAGGRGAGRVG